MECSLRKDGERTRERERGREESGKERVGGRESESIRNRGKERERASQHPLTGAGLRFYSRCRASKSESGTRTGETTQRQRDGT